MKKLFAIVLGIILTITSFTIPAVAVESATRNSPITIFPYDSSEQETLEIIRRIVDAEANKSSDEVVPDGIITLELIENWSGSWKEFVNATLPIEPVNYAVIENMEDKYCVMLIRAINKKREASIYHNKEFVSCGLGGIQVKEVQLSRLLTKFYGIINLYNEAKEVQLVWEPKMLSEEIMQVDVKSTNLEWLENPARFIGQKVQLRKGAIYWESDWNGGSGKYGIATEGNSSIPEDYIVTVNGCSYMDENWTNTSEFQYVPYNKIGIKGSLIKSWERRLLHICTETIDLGWVYAEDVMEY